MVRSTVAWPPLRPALLHCRDEFHPAPPRRD